MVVPGTYREPERKRLGTSEGAVKEGDLEERASGLSLEALAWRRRVCLLV